MLLEMVLLIQTDTTNHSQLFFIYKSVLPLSLKLLLFFVLTFKLTTFFS